MKCYQFFDTNPEFFTIHHQNRSLKIESTTIMPLMLTPYKNFTPTP
jgi:hypothetical protein